MAMKKDETFKETNVNCKDSILMHSVFTKHMKKDILIVSIIILSKDWKTTVYRIYRIKNVKTSG